MPRPLHLPSFPGNDLKGRVALITGGSAGIGFQTAVQLVRRNCSVVITSRSKERGVAAASAIRELASKPIGQNTTTMMVPEVGVLVLDVRSSLANIVGTAKAFREQYDRLDILCFNAGSIQPGDKKLPEDVTELYSERLAANHILTSWLWDLLVKSGTTDSPSRVISTMGIVMTMTKHSSQKWLELVQNAPEPGEVQGKTLDQPVEWFAAFGWAQALAKACDTAQVPVLFLLSHPGLATGTEIASGSSCFMANLVKCIVCCVGSHEADEACLSNVAAATLPARTEIPQGGLVGPLNRSEGQPAVEELEHNPDDAKKWQSVTGEPMLKLGTLALADLAKKCASVEMPNRVFDGLDVPH